VNALVSIGIGEVVALWLLFRHRVAIETAIGTGVLVLAACSVLGLVLHAQLGGVPWSYLAFTAPGAALGGHLRGAPCARRGCAPRSSSRWRPWRSSAAW
jgi:uncharacterized membrane protein YfcA